MIPKKISHETKVFSTVLDFPKMNTQKSIFFLMLINTRDKKGDVCKFLSETPDTFVTPSRSE
jgi:hypothetical protein